MDDSMAKDFVENPSHDKLLALKKTGLLEVAGLFNLSVKSSMTKPQLRKEIIDYMIDNDMIEETALQWIDLPVTEMAPGDLE